MSEVFHRIALVNPNWSFEGSRYWGCTESHLPLELLYAEALLRDAGITATVIDAKLEGLDPSGTAERVEGFGPDLVVITTAPSYLFWRCPPPELDVPCATNALLRDIAPVVAIGPHGSATPRYVLDRLGCHAVVRGEPEEELVRLATGCDSPATVRAREVPGRIAEAEVGKLPALDYSSYPLELRSHRHHVFSGEGRGAEVESTRGCPYNCSFCNRRFFRGRFRQRPLDRVLSELQTLKARCVDYVYFIDEVFGLGHARELLERLAREPVLQFGCQTRIDLWSESSLDRLAEAGCVSVEFGLESPFPEVQASLNKGCRMDPDRILDLMVYAKGRIPWVQGDLIQPPEAGVELMERTSEWRQRAISRGVWVSEPVPVFPYPGSDLHDQLVGPIDDDSWEKVAARCAC